MKHPAVLEKGKVPLLVVLEFVVAERYEYYSSIWFDI